MWARKQHWEKLLEGHGSVLNVLLSKILPLVSGKAIL